MGYHIHYVASKDQYFVGIGGEMSKVEAQECVDRKRAEKLAKTQGRVIVLEEHPNTFGCFWKIAGEDKPHYGFGDLDTTPRARLYLQESGGYGVSNLLKVGIGVVCSTKKGGYGGAERGIEFNLDELEAYAEEYWNQVNAAEAARNVDSCHYCGMPATGTNFFDVPVCRDCS